MRLRGYLCGLVGAGVLTAIHQLGQRVRDDAPRMDVMGMRALGHAVRGTGNEPPPAPRLFQLALAGDVTANATYYAFIPAGTRAATWTRAVLLGVAAGVGALLLPRHIGLGDPPHSDELTNQAMTVSWYLAGALATAAAAELTRRHDP